MKVLYPVCCSLYNMCYVFRLSTSIAGLLEDLPFDEVCSSVRHTLTQLLYPSAEVELARDETDHSSGVLNNLNHRKSSKRIAAVQQLAQMATEENSVINS